MGFPFEGVINGISGHKIALRLPLPPLHGGQVVEGPTPPGWSFWHDPPHPNLYNSGTVQGAPMNDKDTPSTQEIPRV